MNNTSLCEKQIATTVCGGKGSESFHRVADWTISQTQKDYLRTGFLTAMFRLREDNLEIKTLPTTSLMDIV